MSSFFDFGGDFIPDIKEKQPIKNANKERRNTAPKEMLRRGSAQMVAKTKEQIIEASRGGQEEEQGNQQVLPELHVPSHHHGTKKVKESKAEPKTRENYVENLQNQQGGIPEAFRNKHTAELVDIRPTKEIETGPVAIPKQGSQALMESQGRTAARKKMVQKQAARKRLTPTDAESVGVSLHPKAPETETIRPADGKSAGQIPRTKDVVLAETPKQPVKTASPKARVTTSVSAKATCADKTQSKTLKTATPKTAKLPKGKESIKTAATAVKKPTQASVAVQKAARKAAKNASNMTQKTAKQAAQTAAKAIFASMKALVTALGASGTTVVAIVLVLVMVGGIVASPLGIFFSNSTDSDLPLQQVMGRINAEFSQMITDIENSVPHDAVEQTGRQSLWKDVLAVYAVKVSTDAENPLDVATMDEERATLLREIFMDMNTIDYYTEHYTEEVTVEVTDEEGNVTEEPQTVERTRLIIVISGKTAEEMAEEYEFDEEQLRFLTELLSEEYEELWYGLPGGGSDDIVEVALLQVGNVGGEPYWSWYGYSSRVAWCACFVSWCADQCGYIESGAMLKHSYCPTGVQWFKNQGQWLDRGITPEPGYIIYFDWDYDGISDHIGIVEYSNGGVVYTIEGNADDACQKLAYNVGSRKILGYGVIME